jgi:transcription termination factor Rho
MVMAFLLQEKDNYRLKAQSPFVPEPLIKRFGLKTGHSCQGLHSSEDGGTPLVQF